jgi:hypothetical protein
MTPTIGREPLVTERIAELRREADRERPIRLSLERGHGSGSQPADPSMRTMGPRVREPGRSWPGTALQRGPLPQGSDEP